MDKITKKKLRSLVAALCHIVYLIVELRHGPAAGISAEL
jgi:hypothetical protein